MRVGLHSRLFLSPRPESAKEKDAPMGTPGGCSISRAIRGNYSGAERGWSPAAARPWTSSGALDNSRLLRLGSIHAPPSKNSEQKRKKPACSESAASGLLSTWPPFMNRVTWQDLRIHSFLISAYRFTLRDTYRQLTQMRHARWKRCIPRLSVDREPSRLAAAPGARSPA